MKLRRQKPKARRRELTIQEVGRPKVFSYASARSQQQRLTRDENKEKDVNNKRPQGKSRLSKAVNICIALFIVISIGYLFVLHPEATIKVSGQEAYPRNKNSYQEGVNRMLKSSIFYRSKPTFNAEKLAGDIKAQFPEVDEVTVDLPFIRHEPVIEVKLSQPTAKLVTTDKTYILDEEGTALFEEQFAASSLDTERLLSINDSSGHPVMLGKPALTEQQISFIREVIGQTSQKGLKAQSFSLSAGGTAVDARFEGVKYFIKFSFFADARRSSGAFIAIKNQLDSNNIKPNEYIDLRIPDKAFVK